jgi:hypothetical protein
MLLCRFPPLALMGQLLNLVRRIRKTRDRRDNHAEICRGYFVCPASSRLVSEPELWPWSSAAVHCGTNEHDAFVALDAWRPTGPLQLGDSTSEKGKSNPSWPSFVNEHTQGARWELQSLFKILRRPRNGS